MNFEDDKIREKNYCDKINDVCPKYSSDNDEEVFDDSKNKALNAGLVNKYFIKFKELLSLKFLKKPSYKDDNQNNIITVNVDETEILLKLTEMVYKDDRSFLNSFLKIYPEFSSKLLNINSNFKSNDIFFCALLKLNLQTKEIAVIQKTSVKAVEAKKYRIRKKLKLQPNACLYTNIREL